MQDSVSDKKKIYPNELIKERKVSYLFLALLFNLSFSLTWFYYLSEGFVFNRLLVTFSNGFGFPNMAIFAEQNRFMPDCVFISTFGKYLDTFSLLSHGCYS